MRTRVRFITIALASTVLVGAFLAVAASAGAAAPWCFGKKATIVGTNGADVLSGRAKDDVIVGLGGNDTILGLGGRDLICGGLGNDKLYGGPSHDRIRGDVGNDQMFSEGGTDNMEGGPGNDTLDGSGSATPVWALFLNAFNGVRVDLSTGQATGEGTDKLIGISAVLGSNFNDTLIGDEDTNVLAGLGGDDAIDGGDGLQDLAGYWLAREPVTVDLTAGTATGDGTDTLTGIERVGGGPFNDTITGDANPNSVWGWGGNDTISSLDGDDTVYGNDGDDTIDAGNGTDVVDGGSETDSCLNGEGVTNCES